MARARDRYRRLDRSQYRQAAEHLAHRVLDPFGLELRRTDRSVRQTLPAVLEHYRSLGLRPATVIDVGVGHGTPQLHDGFPEAHLVLVEPLEEWRETMEAIARSRPTEIVFAAAGPAPGTIDIAVHRAPVCSSVFGSRPGEPPATNRSVPVVTLDDVIAEHGLQGPFVLKIDVEGAELEVLAGAGGALGQTELALLEVSLFESMPGIPLFHDVVARMHELGFVVGEFYDAHNRPLDNSLAMLDVAFVKEHGPFRAEQRYARPEQADELYRSWGF